MARKMIKKSIFVCSIYNNLIEKIKMKKRMLLIVAVIGTVLSSCVENSELVVGAWVEPVPGLTGQVQGIKLEKGGIASSVNMATLVYESWKQEGKLLILSGKSIGNGQTILFTDTMEITKLTADSLVLDNRGVEVCYVKQ